MPTIETENMLIEYTIEKEKESNTQPPYETRNISEVQVYVPAIQDWLDVTELDSEKIEAAVDALIDEQHEEDYDKYN